MSVESEALDVLLSLMERFERGPKREGAFALWLVARVAVDVGEAEGELDRGGRKRLSLLDRRLAPLAVPRPLARGLATALSHLQEGTPTGARIALSQLVAPAREALAPEAGESLALLAKALHERRG